MILFSTINFSTLKVFDDDFSNVEFFNVEIFAPAKHFSARCFFLASNISLAFTLHLSKEMDASRFFGARKARCVDFIKQTYSKRYDFSTIFDRGEG